MVSASWVPDGLPESGGWESMMEPGFDGAEDRCHYCGNPDTLPMSDPFGFPVCVTCKPRADTEAAAADQKEMDYWARQPRTVTFEITIDPDGAEVSCGANSSSWQVVKEDGEGRPNWAVEPSYDPFVVHPTTRVDSLYGAIGIAVQRMLEARAEGDGI